MSRNLHYAVSDIFTGSGWSAYEEHDLVADKKTMHVSFVRDVGAIWFYGHENCIRVTPVVNNCLGNEANMHEMDWG